MNIRYLVDKIYCFERRGKNSKLIKYMLLLTSDSNIVKTFALPPSEFITNMFFHKNCFRRVYTLGIVLVV